MPDASRTHLVLIPSYNTGERLFSTVEAARAQWSPVWVVVDGSTDGTGERLQQMVAGAGTTRGALSTRAEPSAATTETAGWRA